MKKKPPRKIKNIKSAKKSKSICRFWNLAARLEHRRIKSKKK